MLYGVMNGLRVAVQPKPFLLENFPGSEWDYFVTHSCNVRHKNPDPQWGDVACPQYPANDPYMLPDQYFSK
jgi:hypothetical protein